MNQAMENIFSRRSTRSYKKEQITENELLDVLDAGMHAPSAMNQQSWFMVAVQNPKMVENVRRLCVDTCGMGADANPFYGAPTIILVFAKEGNIAPEKDASLAMQNMMLAAHAAGLGSCWINCVITAYNSEEGKKMAADFDVPEGYAPVGSLALGYIETPNTNEKKINRQYVIIK